MNDGRLPARLALTTLALALVNVAAADSTARYTTRPNLDRLQGAPNQADGPLVVGRNRLIINKTGAQSETTIAVDPTNGNHILASSNDLSNLSSFNNVRESIDGGRTWVNSGVTINTFCYDPWLSFNANGDAFFAYECGDQRIAYKLAGTNTWVHRTLQNSSLFPDRDMVVVDTHAGSPFLHSVYVGYDEANAGNAAHVWYSRDGFDGWSKSPTINDNGQTIGVNVATCPDGSIYAFWEDYQQRRIKVDRSTDGGATWGTDHIVHTYRLNTTSFFIFIPPQPQRGVLPMPFSDCAPAGGVHPGRVYVTYFDKSPTSNDTDAYVRFSDDGGVTWSSEAEVDDETVDAYQFHSNITVGPDGTVAVGFYDTRADFPANQKTHRFISYSTDGGVTWSTNEQVASRQSDESGFGDGNDYGDYQGIDARPDAGFWSVWTDSRPALDAEDVAGARTRP